MAIFKRREKKSFLGQLHALVTPAEKGWKRGFVYIGKRVQRLPDTPHRIALGFACGALASFTPFFTLHLFVAMFFAWIVRGNLYAAAFGTIVGNPISFPLIAAACFNTGTWLLGMAAGIDLNEKLTFGYMMDAPWDFFKSIFTPYLIGGIIPGLIAAVVFYYLLRPLISSFQVRRREILMQRANAAVAERMAGKSTPAKAAGVAPHSADGLSSNLTDELHPVLAKKPQHGAG